MSETNRICEECGEWFKTFRPHGYCPYLNTSTMEDRICPYCDEDFKKKILERMRWNGR